MNVMKVLFVMKYPLVDQYSIMQKLNGEINAVRNLGHEVYYISFDRNYLYLDNGNERVKLKKTTLGHIPNYFHTIVFYDIYNAARKAIHDNNFDIVYFRHSPLNYSGYKMIKEAHKKAKLVVEISSFPPFTEKAKNIFRILYQMISKKWWKQSAKYVSLFTGIGEAAEEYLDRTKKFPYKIEENDLCYKLFKEHGFNWGGNCWESRKDYQHFELPDEVIAKLYPNN